MSSAGEDRLARFRQLRDESATGPNEVAWYLLGALAFAVDDETWDAALGIVSACVRDAEQRQAGL